MSPRGQGDVDDLTAVLDRLCPMYALLDGTGHIVRVGPTLQKLSPRVPMPGRRFLELFALSRPRAVSSLAGLLALGDARLHLHPRDAPRIRLKGVVVPEPHRGGAILNLSFGISVLDAVRDYALTSADFAATDLAIELLYLVEAKSAAMEASRTLNLRLQGAMIAAEEQAFTDTLTGLKNRRALNHVLQRLGGAGPQFAVMLLDLDFFKTVNDTMGHAAGDHVLQHVARIMVAEVREEDTVARVGGDEFVLVFHGLHDRARLEQIATRLIGRLQRRIPFNNETCRISASIGIALSPSFDDPTAQQTIAADILHRADLALYAAKAAGRGCHRMWCAELAGPADRRVPQADAERHSQA